MKVISSKLSIFVWMTVTNAARNLVILKYSCITPFRCFISLWKVIIPMSFSCVCLSSVSALLVRNRDEPIYNSVRCFTPRSLEGRLTGNSVKLLQSCAVSLSRNVSLLCLFSLTTSPHPKVHCIMELHNNSQSLHMLCFLGIMPL